MTDYTGSKCPVCGRPFTAHDDIVVCPECGAPYHRECYTQAGKCVFSDKHGASFTWSPPQEKEAWQEGEPAKRCPRCGCPNSEHALFCQHCGLPLAAGGQQNPGGYPGGQPQQNGGFPPYGAPFNPNASNGFPPQNGFPDAQIPFIFDPMGGVNPNEPIDDVPAGDVAKLVQNNTQYYLPVFMNEKKFGHNRFNFSAFLFTGGWLLYRKLYKIGSIVTAVMLALHLLSFYVSLNFAGPIFETIMQQTGISSDSLVTSYDQALKIWELIAQLPLDQVLLCFLPSFISIVEFVIMLVVGFSGNKWYSRHCTRKVKQIREETQNTSEAAVRLQEEGGVNTALAASLVICYMILLYISNF